MVVCIIVYMLVAGYVLLLKMKKVPAVLGKKERKQIILILIAANTLALFVFLLDASVAGEQQVISRNDYGQGNRKEDLEVTVEGEVHEEPLQIEVQERKYTKAETKALFQKVMEGLDEMVLGKNESKDKVVTNLNLVSTYPGTPIEIAWELSRYDVINEEGEIVQSRLQKEGTLVELKGTLSYDGKEAQYLSTVKVYEKTKTKKEQLLEGIQSMVSQADNSMKEKESLKLPDTWNGKPITWMKEKENRGYIVLAIGIFGAFSVILLKKQNQKKQEEERKHQMMLDYPEIVNKLVLLLGAGMTVKNVWKKMVLDYREQREIGGVRYAYEEMEYAFHEMQSGITEAEGYERFGARCNLRAYRKLGALLSQNIRKGTKGIMELLSMEAEQAFEERKELAKKLGEEASTKLLLPMFFMLAIVLVIIIVPAFLSVQI